MPKVLSSSFSTFSSAIGCQKLGQPVPDSNFVSELNSALPQQMQRYRPVSWLSQYLPVKAISVPSWRVTSKACGESCCRHSLSVFTVFGTCTVSLRSPESVNSTIVTSCGCPPGAGCFGVSTSAVFDFLEKKPIIKKYSPPPAAAAETRKARREVLPVELLSTEVNIVLPVKSTSPRQKRIASFSSQDAQQFAVGRIVAQLPEHHAAQMLLADIFHLFLHRFGAVIAPEVFVVPDAAGAGVWVKPAV